jgi:pimeloyl-ACP methyl ester carboxylesterase
MGALAGGLAALDATAGDPGLLQFRLDDISAILTAERARCAVPFTVLAGHSMGARTVAIEAGAGNNAGLRGQDRFDAYIAVSPQGEGSRLFPRGAYASIRKPMLLITGTRDGAANGGWETRLSTFDGLTPGRKRFAIIDEAGHMALGGRDGRVGALVGSLSVEFLRGLRPGPWRAAEARADVRISDK